MAAPSLPRKLRMIMMGTTSVALLLASAAFVAADRADARRIARADLATMASVIGSNSAAALAFADQQAAREVLGALRAKPAILEAVMYTQAGLPLATYGTPGPEKLAGVPMPRSTRERIEIVRDVFLREERVGSIYIASDLSEAAAQLRAFVWVTAAILMVSLGVASLMSWRLQKLVTQPILELANTAQQVTSARDYTLRARSTQAARTEDEVGTLVSAFNDMLTEIQRRDGELQRHRDHLEAEVGARTAELSAANSRLVQAKDLAERVAGLNAHLSRQRQSILDAAGEGILGLDRELRITFINPRGADMFRCTAEEVVGEPLHDLIHRPAADALRIEDCPICGPRRAVEQQPWVGTLRRQDGTSIPVEFVASTMRDENGWRTGLVVTFRDVTERLAIDRMKGEFVSTVSHELRTPLTSIRGALGLMGSGLLGDPGGRGRRMLEIAISNTDRLVRLINDILDLERMESGRVEIHRASCRATSLMDEAIDVVHPVAEAAGIRLTRVAADIELLVDHDRIIQTLTNLLGNAVKFSPPGTEVTVSGTVESGSFRFSVSDHGRGIPAGKLETIFERFQQVDASDSRAKGGSGLGLAICRSIVTAHGGRIWAESEGEGSSFHFTLPLPARAAETRPARDGAPTVLIVEDDGDLARVLGEAFRGFGIHTLHAPTGTDALAACERGAPSLIVLDVLLPELDGFGVVRRMREDESLACVPLVVFSAQEITDADQRRLRLGPTAFLTKSRASIQELGQCVLSMLFLHHSQTTGETDAAETHPHRR